MRPLLFNLVFYGFTFCAGLVAWVFARLGAHGAARRIVAWWSRRVLGAVRVILRGRIEVRGRERLPPGGPRLLVAKHQSELDAILLFSLFPELGAVVMRELDRYPFVGAILRALGMVVVSTDGGPQGRTPEVVRGAARVLAEGRPLLIYPEGTLMSLGAKSRYRAGAWRIHAATGATVTPVALSLGAIWPRREWRKRVGRTGAIEFLEPMPDALDKTRFMEALEARIEERTMALIREHAERADLAAAEDRFARGAANED